VSQTAPEQRLVRDPADLSAASWDHPVVEDEVLDRLVRWGEGEPACRAMILTSTRARPEGPVDEHSDYDVILAVTDPLRFADALDWQAAGGRPLVRWGDESELHGLPTWFRGVVYHDFAKIDFTIWPDALLEAIAAGSDLPPVLDHGYRVLLDKDARTAGWPGPTHAAYVVSPPDEAEYLALVDEFWWDTTYVAKALLRGELFFARSFMLEHDLKVVALRRMLEWRIAIDQAWRFAPGVYGRGLEHHLDGETRAALDATCSGPGAEATWDGLSAVTELFSRVAIDVASALGYEYPQQVHDAMTDHLGSMRSSAVEPASDG
jgi:aminoglycoside 6-adenylyltransferase